jgi:hypothetical protein
VGSDDESSQGDRHASLPDCSRVRVGSGLIGTPEEGELSQGWAPHLFARLLQQQPDPWAVAGDHLAYLHSLSPSRPACSWSRSSAHGRNGRDPAVDQEV